MTVQFFELSTGKPTFLLDLTPAILIDIDKVNRRITSRETEKCMEQTLDCNIWPALVMYREGESSGTATKELGLLVIHVVSESY